MDNNGRDAQAVTSNASDNAKPPPEQLCHPTDGTDGQNGISRVREVNISLQDKRATADHKESEMARPATEAESVDYPQGFPLILLMVALWLITFCVAIDNTIVATATPRITDQFHSLQDVGWYGSAYLLLTCAFQLFFGKLYSLFPVKYVYLAALLIFEVGSAVCGAAPTSPALIIGRAIAGLGASGSYSGAFVIIAHATPTAKRPFWLGLAGDIYGISSILGPL